MAELEQVVGQAARADHQHTALAQRRQCPPESQCARRIDIVWQRDLQHGHVRVRLEIAQRHPGAVIKPASGVDRGVETCRQEQSQHLRGQSWLAVRSEEHTSELQSLMRISYAVCCLKKKNMTEDKRPQTTLRMYINS